MVTAFTLLCSVAGFACAKGVRLPDEQSEELCEAKSQEVERRSPLTHTLPLYTFYMFYTAIPSAHSASLRLCVT